MNRETDSAQAGGKPAFIIVESQAARCAITTLIAATILFAAPAYAQWNHLGPVTGIDRPNDKVLDIHCGDAILRISAISDHILRVCLAPDGIFAPNHSWAVEDTTPRARFAATRHAEDRFIAMLGGLRVTIQRDPCRLSITDTAGQVLVADDPIRGMAWRPGSATPTADGRTITPPYSVRAWQQLPDGTEIYGLGEKTGQLNKVGQAWTMWNSDTWGYGRATDPIYQSIPFFVGARDGVFWGVLFDNPWRTSFDLGKEDRYGMSIGAEGGELNYYVIAGPGPKDILRRYTDLTGRLPLPPKWALGYHQCRHSYFPETRVREIARNFREKHIPCDVLYYDIEYMDEHRPFTWNKEHFPDPRKLNTDLKDMGFHTVAIIDPGIGLDPGRPVYDSGEEINAWLTKPDGAAYVGRVWPGDTVFPDFTNPQVRDWWADLFPPFINSCGIDGIWNDMNEPADFAGPHGTVPLDLVHDNEGHAAPHLACHNVYGQQMVRATMEGLRRTRPDQRPFTITRATYAGGQRYGCSWTGDNLSTWEHLRMSISMVLGLGVSGMPFTGPDIGGFSFGASPTLYARWIQVGSLFPFCRTHTGWNSPNQEPWAYGPEVERIARESLERRYMLMPYLYTLFEEASRTGVPVMRPIWMEFDEYGGWALDFTFLVGPYLYVVPQATPSSKEYEMKLPPGVWFDYHTGRRIEPGQEATVAAELDTLPLFVRAGAIIPMQSPVESTMFAPDEPLIIHAWPEGESSFVLYEDDGESLEYQKGAYRRTQLECKADEKQIVFTMHEPTGSYAPPQRSPLLRVHGVSGNIRKIRCQSADITAEGSQVDDKTLLASVQPALYTIDSTADTCTVRMHVDTGCRQVVTLELRFADAQDK